MAVPVTQSVQLRRSDCLYGPPKQLARLVAEVITTAKDGREPQRARGGVIVASRTDKTRTGGQRLAEEEQMANSAGALPFRAAPSSSLIFVKARVAEQQVMPLCVPRKFFECIANSRNSEYESRHAVFTFEVTNNFSSIAGSMGLTMWESKPAASDLRRSSSCPQPVSATSTMVLPHGFSRIALAVS